MVRGWLAASILHGWEEGLRGQACCINTSWSNASIQKLNYQSLEKLFPELGTDCDLKAWGSNTGAWALHLDP